VRKFYNRKQSIIS